jgi:hypothetical protein
MLLFLFISLFIDWFNYLFIYYLCINIFVFIYYASGDALNLISLINSVDQGQ